MLFGFRLVEGQELHVAMEGLWEHAQAQTDGEEREECTYLWLCAVKNYVSQFLEVSRQLSSLSS